MNGANLNNVIIAPFRTQTKQYVYRSREMNTVWKENKVSLLLALSLSNRPSSKKEIVVIRHMGEIDWPKLKTKKKP